MTAEKAPLEIEELILEFSASRILFEEDASPNAAHVVVSLRDVTERVAAEERFRATFEQAAIGMAVVSIEGRILRVNSRLCTMLGYTPDEMLARTLHDVTHPGDLGADLRQLGRLLAGEIPTYTIEKRYLRKDGSELWAERTVSLVRRSDLTPDYFVALVEDITPRRNLEAQLLQSQKMDAIGQLAGGVAHDFNNMLTAIQGHTALLGMDGALTEPARESVAEIAKASQRAASLTRQLLLFSRREIMQPVLLDLNDSVTQLTRMLQRLIGENVRMKLHLHPRSLPVFADPGMLDQVLMNLAVNARDAMPDGGELVIETGERTIDADDPPLHPEAAPGRYACLGVSDTGCGIPPGIRSRIFEPFFTTKELGKGTGLGLATVFGIVKQHRGWLDVASEIGQGSTFRIFLPLSEVEAAPPAALAETTAPRGDGATILLVEDDATVRAMAATVLKQNGYKVIPVSTGREAVARWRRASAGIHVLLTDLVLPGALNGHVLANTLQAERPELAVILTSGYGAEIAGRSLDVRVNRVFLQKPYEPARLLSVLHDLLHHRP